MPFTAICEVGSNIRWGSIVWTTNDVSTTRVPSAFVLSAGRGGGRRDDCDDGENDCDERRREGQAWDACRPMHVIPPWRWTRYGSDDLELGGKGAAREAVERERVERGVATAGEERVGDDPADRRGRS